MPLARRIRSTSTGGGGRARPRDRVRDRQGERGLHLGRLRAGGGTTIPDLCSAP